MPGVAMNRSPEAHRADPRSKRFENGVDERVTTFVAQSIDPDTGRPAETQAITAQNSVHPTSVGADVNAVHGDNKGFAREQLEEELGAPVLMFSGAQGDNSPNGPELKRSNGIAGLLLGIFGRRGREKLERPGTDVDPFAHMFESGSKQAAAILPLVHQIQTDTDGSLRVKGPIQTFSTWVDFSNVTLANGERTHPPMIGKDTLAGTEDQRGIEVAGFPILREGVKPRGPARTFWSVAGKLTGAEGEHGPKQGIGARFVEPIYKNGLGGVPEILPLTLHRLGDTVIIGVPFELTANAGDELEQHLLDTLKRALPGEVDRVVIQGYSNGYAQYVTTKAEYELQHYEGSSTLFGPNTLQAIKEKSAELATALVTGVAPESAEPPPIIFPRIKAKGPKEHDKAPRGRKLDESNKTLTPAADRYSPGDRVVVEYFGGDARRRQRTTNVLEVRRHDPVNGGFHPIANQGHSSTRVKWMPDGKTHTYRVEWRIPRDLPPGRYQLWHTTTYKPKGSPDEVTDRFHSGIFEVAPK
jgi:neutral ceramidase